MKDQTRSQSTYLRSKRVQTTGATSLLRHLGRELDISTLDLVSVRALYARGRTQTAGMTRASG
ncbi:MAG: hypothetical protein EON54_13710 [Alcaligenaceae bacterium]|nr:MAG: hypothetical protein EON54_13710 [Alcaligenaceae bacterium]